jgi:3-deoxy-manno-octulosonate cytidylyltransferase (CMP-KDO synthetase)
MLVVAIIPARFGSTRFPGKPLANATGKTLIQHVYERVCEARRVSECVVATDDQRIADAVELFGGRAVMTRADHATGTDRIAEVVAETGRPDDLVLNVQGDEPEIEPVALDRLIERMQSEPEYPCGTLACPFPADVDPGDPNRVKVVCDLRGRAMYFSRAQTPFPRDATRANEPRPWLLHLGVYAYRRSFLLELAAWPPTPLECIEQLEQLRILERGRSIAVEIVERASPGVDTPEDYEAFVSRWNARTRSRTAAARGERENCLDGKRAS